MRTLLIIVCFAAAAATALQGADATAGKAVYDKSCKNCHGAGGTPSAGMAKAMNIKDFKTSDFSDADIKTAVSTGKGKMKPVAGVAGASLDNVAAYVKSLKQ